ncbi:hypothetical protein RSAG8_13701, partial [Rhizoctonia solani AG-8 WAC10335]
MQMGAPTARRIRGGKGDKGDIYRLPRRLTEILRQAKYCNLVP